MFAPKIKILVFSLVLALPLGLATAASQKSGAAKSEDEGVKLSRADEKFIKDAAAGGMMEVELGKIAADKGTDEKVKEFGRRMQQDHGKANEELKQIAADKGVKIPTKLEGKQKKTVDRLSKLSGAEFDRQYIRTMIEDHKEDIEKFSVKQTKERIRKSNSSPASMCQY